MFPHREGMGSPTSLRRIFPPSPRQRRCAHLKRLPASRAAGGPGPLMTAPRVEPEDVEVSAGRASFTAGGTELVSVSREAGHVRKGSNAYRALLALRRRSS